MQDPDTQAELPEAVVELATRMFGLAREGATTTLEAYIDAGVAVNLTNDSGDSLLMLAAYHGWAETVASLLGRGADPNRANDRGQTPLAGAVFKGEIDVIRVLVDGGADPNAGQPSAFATAAVFARQDIADLLKGMAGPPAQVPPLPRE